MKICVRCAKARCEGSFYDDSDHPRDVCKVCIHRPQSPSVKGARKERHRSRHTRARTAICHVVKRFQADEGSLVYLIRGHKCNFKIGTSGDVNKRLRQLSVGNSAFLELIAVAPGGYPLEQELHHEFRKLRIRGEWFRDQEGRIIAKFATLPRTMVFQPGYVSSSPPDAQAT